MHESSSNALAGFVDCEADALRSELVTSQSSPQYDWVFRAQVAPLPCQHFALGSGVDELIVRAYAFSDWLTKVAGVAIVVAVRPVRTGGVCIRDTDDRRVGEVGASQIAISKGKVG